MAKKDKPFNNPFDAVKLKTPEPPPKKAAPPAPRPPRPRDAPLSEEEQWQMAVDGAAPLLDRSQTIRPKAAPISHALVPLDPELAAYDELRSLVEGEVPFDLSNTDELIEGATRGLDPRIVKRLKRGELSLQGHLDLHGLVRAEAKAELERFVQSSRAAGKRCVLIVHGRGLHSKDQVPVLKDAIRVWMTSGRIARDVLAFATARPSDGGAGAVYVLLRRRDPRR